jgi:transposase-like protein
VDIIKEFLDTIKQFKHQTPKPKFCPICKSHNVILKETYGALPQIYNCKDCTYEGLIILEIAPEELG